MADSGIPSEHNASPAVTPLGATIAIFGASGDLTARKLMPALFDLWHDGYLADDTPIIGLARREKTDESFRNEIFEAINGKVRAGADLVRPMEPASPSGCSIISSTSRLPPVTTPGRSNSTTLEAGRPEAGNRVVYMATSPGSVPSRRRGPRRRRHDSRPRFRPIGCGSCLKSRSVTIWPRPSELSADLTAPFAGRADLPHRPLSRQRDGAEHPAVPVRQRDLRAAVQPQPRRSCADHRGRIAGDGARPRRLLRQLGRLRDVLQNHVLQLLCLVAMEPPALFRARADLHDEKLKVLQGPVARRSRATSPTGPSPGSTRPADVDGETGGRLSRRGPHSAGLADARRSWRWRCGSTTGGGPACRSICGPASGCRRA